MSTPNFFVGLDVHKDTITIAARSSVECTPAYSFRTYRWLYVDETWS